LEGAQSGGFEKNVDKNPLYNPINGKELPVYEPASDDHQILATPVISAPDSIPELTIKELKLTCYRCKQRSYCAIMSGIAQKVVEKQKIPMKNNSKNSITIKLSNGTTA
jgi:hypothetical protein